MRERQLLPINSVYVHDPDRGRGDGEVARVQRDAVGERDAERGDCVRERVVADGDVCDPAERQARDGLDEREDVPERGEAPREQVVVAHEKARRARQRERVRGDKVGRAQRAHVLRLCRERGVEDELLDGRVCARVVDDEKVGGGVVVGGVDVHAEGVEVVCGGVALERHAVDRVRAGGV